MSHIDPQVFSSVWVALAVLAIVIAGSIVQAGLGMGFGLTVAPVLALIDPVLVPAPALFLGTATSLMGAWSERENIVWPEIGIGLIGRSLGIVAGAYVLYHMTDRATFSLVFGTIILFVVGLSIAGWSLALNAKNLLSMGWISGFTGVITSVGAPPLALIYQNRPARHARPTLATFFAFGGAISLMVLYLTGWAGMRDLALAAFIAPAAIVGTWMGRRLRGRLDRSYRPALLLIASIAAVLLILRGLAW